MTGTTRGAPGLVAIFPRKLREPPSTWRISKTSAVGRRPDADVQCSDPKLSRLHAHVEPGHGGLTVCDAGSRHGSSVDGVCVGAEPMPARYGSVVRFGDTLFLVVDDVSRYAAPPRSIAKEALGFPRDVVAGPVLSEVWDQVARVAQLTDPVLILGESGTGKEIAARITHLARRHAGPFVGINIAAIPEGLFEAEVFGHERGAFTGATRQRLGAFREASDGVLFLDEVADLRVELQVKLLRAIDQQCVRPIGATGDVPVNARLVAATSQNLKERAAAGNFRLDLYYRLAGIIIHVPPLRERRDDILLLATTMLEEDGAGIELSTDAAETLAAAHWEGNARSLRYAVTHASMQAVVANSKKIKPEYLPDLSSVDGDEGGELTADAIRRAMSQSGGVVAQAARLLKVSRTTFYKSCKRLGIDTSQLRRK
jgi:DNA-binding NtrC family response regulator